MTMLSYQSSSPNKKGDLTNLKLLWCIAVATIAFLLLLQPLEKAVKGTRSIEEQSRAVASKDEFSAAGISVRSSWGPAVELGLWTFLGTALQVCRYCTIFAVETSVVSVSPHLKSARSM